MEYKYLIVDAQWLLTRNFKVKCNYPKEGDFYLVDGKPVPDENNQPLRNIVPSFDASILATSFFQSIRKFVIETFDSLEKVILLWDKYPYHKFQLVADYKGDRHYAKEEDKEGLDPIKDARQIIETNLEIANLKIKQEAKSLIIDQFCKLGLPSFFKSGYEADDLAGEIAKYLYATDSNSKSVLYSVDSDWDYLIQPNVDHLNHRGELTTWDELTTQLKYELETGDVNLYQYKSYVDSVYGSHNNLDRLAGPEVKTHSWGEIIKAIKNNEEGYVTDRPKFEAQLKSFSVVDYPDYDIIQKMLTYIDKDGSIIDDPIEFAIFTGEHGLGFDWNYYEGLKDKLNNSLYKGKK